MSCLHSWCGLVVVSSCAAAAAAGSDFLSHRRLLSAPRALNYGRADFLTIGASGDFIANADMMRLAFPRRDGYQSYFLDGMEWLMQAPDLFMCNHETVAAECVDTDWEDVGKPCPMQVGGVYNFAKWSINNHPRLEADLVALGVDVVSLANNHIMDRGPLGLARTINALDAAGLSFMGARKQSVPIPWEVYTDKKGWRVAWVGCTDYLQDPRANGSDQALFCNDTALPGLITQLSNKSDVDAVIVALHWGKEQTRVNVYQTKVTTRMRALARSFIDAGASAIVGAHPHVLMEMEWYTVHAPGGTTRKGLILYSLGNFVAVQAYSKYSLKRCTELQGLSRKECKRILMSKVVAYFNMEMNDSGKASVSNFSYVVVSWDNERKGMVPVLENVAKKSWAAEVLGEQYRIPGGDSKYYNVEANRFCSNREDQKSLPDVSSVQECRDQAMADQDCGTRFTSNGKECSCTPDGESCNTATSSRGNDLYEMQEVLPGGWKQTKAGHYCGSSGRKNLRDVASVQECLDLVTDDPECGSELSTDGQKCRCVRHGNRCDAKPSRIGYAAQPRLRQHRRVQSFDPHAALQSRAEHRGSAVYRWVESTEGLWFAVRKNMYCAQGSARKDLDEVSSLTDCQALVGADDDCGDTFVSNGQQCSCMRKGEECSYRESSMGNIVYKWLLKAPEQWRAIRGGNVVQADVYSTV